MRGVFLFVSEAHSRRGGEIGNVLIQVKLTPDLRGRKSRIVAETQSGGTASHAIHCNTVSGVNILIHITETNEVQNNVL